MPAKVLYEPVDHPRFERVERRLFTATYVTDCMTHACREHAREPQARLDACCQYGGDVDLFERDEILRRAPQVAPLLPAELRDPSGWFDESSPENYPDFPSGHAVRTAVAPSKYGTGCLFLRHADDARGCVLHRAAIEHDIPLRGFKPMICQLFPITFDDSTLCLADDFLWYDCGNYPGGPSVYRSLRGSIGSVFDQSLLGALDAAEARVLADAGSKHGRKTLVRLPLA